MEERYKGRKTRCITVRLGVGVVKLLEENARLKGLSSAGEYIKEQIMKNYKKGEEWAEKIKDAV